MVKALPLKVEDDLNFLANNGNLCQLSNYLKSVISMATMNISLTPQLEKLVQDRVKSGLYTSASEVIREALRLLEAQDRDQSIERLQADVAAGLKQLEDGKSTTFDEAALSRIKQAGRARLRAVKGSEG